MREVGASKHDAVATRSKERLYARANLRFRRVARRFAFFDHLDEFVRNCRDDRHVFREFLLRLSVKAAVERALRGEDADDSSPGVERRRLYSRLDSDIGEIWTL